MNFSYRFPVVKGLQAGKSYYIAMVPLRMLSKLFPGDDEYVLPEYRAQRKLNESRIPEIKNYIIDNRDNYVFSALAASIDGEFRFIPNGKDDTGILEVSFDARFLINDGQHRKAAILEAIEEDSTLGDETISVVLFEDRGLARSQQMFTDLNKHAVKTSNSIAELYDSRDALAVTTRKVIRDISFLNEYVDKEKDNLGKFSSSFFTLNTFYNANKRILKRGICNSEFEKFLMEYWMLIVKHMIPWNEVTNKQISKKDLRENYIATQAVVIQAFGRIGAFFYEHSEYDMKDYLPHLEEINWRRSSSEWRQRVIRSNGRMINNSKAILLTSNVIKRHLTLPFTEDEELEEKGFLNVLL